MDASGWQRTEFTTQVGAASCLASHKRASRGSWGPGWIPKDLGRFGEFGEYRTATAAGGAGPGGPGRWAEPTQQSATVKTKPPSDTRIAAVAPVRSADARRTAGETHWTGCRQPVRRSLGLAREGAEGPDQRLPRSSC